MSVNSMPKENKMGTMPVKKLIFNMALPLIISMLIQALYNIVDSIFVSRISEDALTAVSLAFPVQNLMIAFATLMGSSSKSLDEARTVWAVIFKWQVRFECSGRICSRSKSLRSNSVSISAWVIPVRFSSAFT